MTTSKNFFKSVAVYVIVVNLLVLALRLTGMIFQFQLGIYWRLFTFAYMISLMLAFWALTQQKRGSHPYLVKTGFVFAFSYFIIDFASSNLNLLAGTNAT